MTDINLSGQRILIVDDVTFARQTLKKILYNLGDPDVLEAQDGLQAEKVLNSEPDIQFVIVDFNMPKSNGLELLKTIRSGGSQAVRSLPVAMLTGYSNEHLVSMALALDVNAFIVKPVSRASLNQRLKKMMRVTQDTSWLKAQDSYDNVPIIEVQDQSADVSRDPAILKSANSTPGTSAYKPRNRSGEKFDEVDLVNNDEERSGRFEAADLADIDLIRKISAISGGTDAKIAPVLKQSLEQLASEVGSEGTRRLVSYLEVLVKTNTMPIEEVAALFTPSSSPPELGDVTAAPIPSALNGEEFFVTLADIPENAILAQALNTQDGSMLLSVGTPLAGEVVKIIRHLSDINTISLVTNHSSDTEELGLYIMLSEAPGVDYTRVKPVATEHLNEGSILARDVHMKDGRRYAVAGSVMTERLISLLQDLEDLGHLDRDIMIAH